MTRHNNLTSSTIVSVERCYDNYNLSHLSWITFIKIYDFLLRVKTYKLFLHYKDMRSSPIKRNYIIALIIQRVMKNCLTQKSLNDMIKKIIIYFYRILFK